VKETIIIAIWSYKLIIINYGGWFVFNFSSLYLWAHVKETIVIAIWSYK